MVVHGDASLPNLLADAQHDPALLREVADDAHGATALFVGTVRNTHDGRAVDGIDYSAYERMALGEMNGIVAEAQERFGGVQVSLVHRLGTLAVGDASVAISARVAARVVRASAVS